MFLSLFCVSLSALEVGDIPPNYQYYADFRQDNADGSYIIRRIYTREPFLLLENYSFPVIQNTTFDSYIYTINYNNGKVDKNVSKGGSWSAVVDKNDILQASKYSIFNYLIYCNFKPINLDEYAEEHPEFADILNKFFGSSINEIADECPLSVEKFDMTYRTKKYLNTSTYYGDIEIVINNKSTKNITFYLTVDDMSFVGTDTKIQSAEHELHCKFNVKYPGGSTGQYFVAKPGINEYYFIKGSSEWLPYLDTAYFNFWLDKYTYLVPYQYGPQLMQTSKFSYKCFATHTEDFFLLVNVGIILLMTKLTIFLVFLNFLTVIFKALIMMYL